MSDVEYIIEHVDVRELLKLQDTGQEFDSCLVIETEVTLKKKHTMTQDILNQAKELQEEINFLKKQKANLENSHADELYYGSKVEGFYTLLPREICCKVKNIILDNLQEQINKKQKQFEAL